MFQLWFGSYLFLLIVCFVNAQKENLEYRCEKEAVWGDWRCPGEEQKCTEFNATRYKCIGGNCTIDSPCVGMDGFQENKPCKFVLQQGLCVPWWASWSPWSKCTATCGFTERSRYRACIGAWSRRNIKLDILQSLQTSCIVMLRAHEGVDNRDCPVRRLCPNVNGAWGEWGPFGPCSATCGFGTRSRMRLCNRPSPQGNGLFCQGIDTQKVPCEGSVPCPQQGEWCPWSTVIRHCSHECGPLGMGLRTRQCACPKPTHGGEGCAVPPEAAAHAEYEETKRSAPEGIPLPTIHAIEAIRTGHGRWEACNRYPCPYLKYLKSDEEQLLLHDLLIQSFEDTWAWSAGIPAKRFEPVQLRCPPSRESRVHVFDKPGRFPKARAYWTRTIPATATTPSDEPGMPVRNTKTILVEGDRLTIRSLISEATGVYRYGYEYEPGYFETVCFFAVYIENSEWRIPFGSTFDLTCNALGLWPVLQKPGLGKWYNYWEVKLNSELDDTDGETHWWYTELMRQHTKEELSNMNLTTSSEEQTVDRGTGLSLWDTEYHRVYQAKPSLSGRYTCVLFNVINSTHNRTFITDSFQLIVGHSPSIAMLVRAWCVQNKWNLLALLITGLVASVISGCCLWRRAQSIARLDVFAKEIRRARRNINLADLDARVD
ncbi:Thrombospondin-2 [Fasciola hepatica]|uniref:Thrombospondin-2 n=1 Tax=Fasciola hepatica TaxID=6192 RepID=A0A4E0RKA2_FASHE|nr:Thrombospondin-2 [Fasciola hepatica]